MYWILLVASSSVLLVLEAISLAHLCISMTKTVHKDRIRAFLLTSFVSCSITLNTMIYLAAMYPGYILFWAIDLTTIQVLLEAIVIIAGFHIFQILMISVVHQLYTLKGDGERSPSWIKILSYIAEFVIISCTLIFYT
eukprot:150969_1